MTREEIKKAIFEKEAMFQKYKSGEIKSKVYTEEEIEEKRQYYLSLEPSKESGRSVKRWQAEVNRFILHSKSFKECPDKIFYHLDTFRILGF